MKPYYSDQYCTIYHGDCRAIIPEVAVPDLILTDPPYGIGYVANVPNAKVFESIEGDSSEPDLAHIFAFDPICPLVIFGANNFPRQLPHRGRWICWDKRVNPKADAMLGSPFELAWTNRKSGYDVMIRVMHGGVVNSDYRETARVHPTQKPTALMKHILQLYPSRATVLDPYMGSGTTLRAAKDLQRKAIGIELEERFCEVAAKRMRQEVLALK